MADFDARPLLMTETASVWDVACPGACKHRSNEEYVAATHFVFPYRGVYVHHVGRTETVAEANQVVILNEDEPYRVSHPFEGGDACLSVATSTEVLLELAPEHYLLTKDRRTAFNRSRLRVDTHTQALAARLRHSLRRGFMDAMEAESLTLALLGRALGERTSHAPGGSYGRQKLVDRAKLVLASDLGRRWSLADIAALVGVSPVYLTQLFRQVEGLPLYRYQLQRRLARALDRLGERVDLTELALDLGFSSYSHFSDAFKRSYGQTPLQFQRDARVR
jgi:AraC family transcriptional regulator